MLYLYGGEESPDIASRLRDNLRANGSSCVGDYTVWKVPQRLNRSMIIREKSSFIDPRWKVSAVLFLAERHSSNRNVLVNPRWCKWVGPRSFYWKLEFTSSITIKWAGRLTLELGSNFWPREIYVETQNPAYYFWHLYDLLIVDIGLNSLTCSFDKFEEEDIERNSEKKAPDTHKMFWYEEYDKYNWCRDIKRLSYNSWVENIGFYHMDDEEHPQYRHHNTPTRIGNYTCEEDWYTADKNTKYRDKTG